MEPQPQTSQEAIPQPEVVKKRRFSKKVLILAGILAAVVLVLVPIVFAMTMQNKQPEVAYGPTSQVKPSVIPSPTSSLPSDWTTLKGVNCNATFPIPPKKEPYYITMDPDPQGGTDDYNSFWELDERTVEDSGPKPFFPKGSFLFYRDANEGGSGYVSGMVSVQCDKNTNNLTTQDAMKIYDEYIGGIIKESTATDSGITPLKNVNKEEITIWGRKVMKFNTEGGMNNPALESYLFATKNNIHLVSTAAMSSNTIVKDTTQKIFENLQFEN